ncbi:osteocalcin [Lissotriton helveticus]
MQPMIFVTLLALTALSLCQGEAVDSNNVPETHRSEAFISKQDSANAFEKREKRSIYPFRVARNTPDPLESKREVCELNPDCDELADHIGFQEAYRRFYGTV